ncbi:MAG: flavodoxin family protein [Planctomycetota bacterium]|jgi:multimeric flavodoxin WrbA|nr:flavodoxin family protein [Planctomycetota bacterium]
MKKPIVILSGSPRKDGNTDQLVGALAAGAKAAGKAASIFRVADLKIGGCLGCQHCLANAGVCRQNDAMPAILDAIRQAQALVFASPVYFFSVSAQLKLAIDRMFALLGEGMPGKRAALLLTCGNPNPQVTSPSIDMFRQIFAYLKWPEAGIVIASGLHKPGEIAGRPELEQARRLGENLCS